MAPRVRTASRGAAATIAALAFGGCFDGARQEPSGEVEIFSWWAGSESTPLEAALTGFKQRYPGITVVNSAVLGGAGTNAKSALRARMLAGDPPDAFQVHAGTELVDAWVRVNGLDDSQSKMAPLDALYDAQGWRSTMQSKVLDLVRYGGHFYSVPVGVHKDNALFYNVKVLRDAGVTPPRTFADLYAACDALRARGITPLSFGYRESWTLSDWFQVVLLAKRGPDFYRAFWSGTGNGDDPAVADTVAEMKRMLACTNADAGALDWVAASNMVHEGTAAMNIMGDWAKGYYSYAFHWQADVDYGEVPTPGTDGAFIAVIDTFAVPRGAPDYDNVLALLAWLGSTDGQRAFTPLKGSISPRSDYEASLYDSISQRTAGELRDQPVVETLDSAAPPAFVDAFRAALGRWAVDQNDAALLGFVRDHYAQLR